jgi:RNA polymerase sigma-70 factor (ECF subfamily)
VSVREPPKDSRAGHPPQAVPAKLAGLFPSTRWTLVLAAKDDPSLRKQVLEDLVRPRWKALYILARRRGLERASAEDAVQSFLARILEAEPGADLIARLDPSRGSLRAYLKTAFAHHLSNLREHDRAEKRGGGARAVDLTDVETLLASPAPNAEQLFDRAWALTLFEEALAALEAEFRSGHRRGPFEVLRELFAFGTAPPYAELAVEHAMTVAQLKAFVHRAKARFRQLVRERVAETLGETDDVDEEVRALLGVMVS